MSNIMTQQKRALPNRREDRFRFFALISVHSAHDLPFQAARRAKVEL
jgi:hypothetical protein